MLLALFLLAFQDAATFRSQVTLVHVDVEVRAGERLIDGLSREDFVVQDGGRREILYFGREEEPLDLILLFDTSASMAPAVANVAETAQKALSRLRSGDRVAVMAFDEETDLILDFTGDFTAVERAIRENVLRRNFIPVSHIQRGVDDAALHFIRQPPSTRRRAVLTVTDNMGSSSESRAVRDMWEANAVASGVVFRSAAFAVTYRIVRPFSLFSGGINGIAERTGGDLIDAGDSENAFSEMILRLRSRYVIHYAMPQAKPGEERKVKVELSEDAARRFPKAKIRARSGYLVPGSVPP